MILTCETCGIVFSRTTHNGRRVFCSKPCHYAAGRAPEIERFWAKVHIDPDTGCWLWTSSTNNKGYGTFYAKRRPGYAHIFSWTHFVGPIPAGKCVLHNCPTGDNPRCCNWEHLWIGTKKENTHDAIQKGRLTPDHLINRPRGSDHPNAVLTETDIPLIRQMARATTHRKTADHFLISKATVGNILRGKIWGHVP